MKKFVFIGSGVSGILLSAYIVLVMSANLTPDTSSMSAAIISTIRIIGITALLALIHVAFQTALVNNRPDDPSSGEKWWDNVTTWLPLVTLLIMWWTMSDMQAKVAWWPTLSRWLFWIILIATLSDLYNFWSKLKKAWDGP